MKVQNDSWVPSFRTVRKVVPFSSVANPGGLGLQENLCPLVDMWTLTSKGKVETAGRHTALRWKVKCVKHRRL